MPVWEYAIEDGFYLTGSGVAVVGSLSGEAANGDRAELHAGDRVTAVPAVWIDFARGTDGDRVALRLLGLNRDEVPRGGAIVRGRPELRRLPNFVYHPDPVQTGSIKASSEACACCGGHDGWIYTGPAYTEDELTGRLCPWCIDDGSAADRFQVTFTDLDAGPNLPGAVIAEVCERTPGFSGWQQERWLSHCGDAAIFLGPVGTADLSHWPQPADAIRGSLPKDWPAGLVDDFLARLDRNGQPTGYLFRCRTCHDHIGYVDFT